MCGDSLVPVGLGVAVERWEHDGQDLGGVVADQAHDVLIVPVVQSSFCHLTRHDFLAWLHRQTTLKGGKKTATNILNYILCVLG